MQTNFLDAVKMPEALSFADEIFDLQANLWLCVSMRGTVSFIDFFIVETSLSPSLSVSLSLSQPYEAVNLKNV